MAERKRQLAASEGIKVRLVTPAEKPLFSRGFYQVEEDLLYVPIFPAGKFYSYVDTPKSRNKSTVSGKASKSSARFSLDIDRKGRLLFIKVATPRRFWEHDDTLKIPQTVETADIRFISFRVKVHRARIQYSESDSLIRLNLDNAPICNTYYITERLIAGLSEDNYLVALWISGIEDDRAAQKMAHWRKDHKNLESEPDSLDEYTRIEID